MKEIFNKNNIKSEVMYFKKHVQYAREKIKKCIIQRNNLTSSEIKRSIKLMRINHTGEVCAQALYRGQAFLIKDKEIIQALYKSAKEEQRHLMWCEKRLFELNSRTSVMNPMWYALSFITGMVASQNTKVNLGFIVETEQQVMIHLKKHLKILPKKDYKSKVILRKMYEEEKIHANKAKKLGGVKLSSITRKIMKIQSKIMTTITYYV